MKKFAYLGMVNSKSFPVGTIKVFEAVSDAEALGGVLDFIKSPGCNLLSVNVWDLENDILICDVKL